MIPTCNSRQNLYRAYSSFRRQFRTLNSRLDKAAAQSKETKESKKEPAKNEKSDFSKLKTDVSELFSDDRTVRPSGSRAELKEGFVNNLFKNPPNASSTSESDPMEDADYEVTTSTGMTSYIVTAEGRIRSIYLQSLVAIYSQAKVEKATKAIIHYYNRRSQSEETIRRKEFFCHELSDAISRAFPIHQLHTTGGTFTGFGEDSSDLDICIHVSEDVMKQLVYRLDRPELVGLKRVAQEVSKDFKCSMITRAIVPLLRVHESIPKFHVCDIFDTEEEKTLNAYADYDIRTAALVLVVKRWAKQRGINDALAGTFSSYGLTLLVIHYLQCGLEVPRLPNLQTERPDKFNDSIAVEAIPSVSLLDKLDLKELRSSPLRPNSFPSTEYYLGDSFPNDCLLETEPNLCQSFQLCELLMGFFQYYSHFKFSEFGVSVRQGQRIKRDPPSSPSDSRSKDLSSLKREDNPEGENETNAADPFKFPDGPIYIEEPYTRRNVSRTVNYANMPRICKAFREAAKMKPGHWSDWFDQLKVTDEMSDRLAAADGKSL